MSNYYLFPLPVTGPQNVDYSRVVKGIVSGALLFIGIVLNSYYGYHYQTCYRQTVISNKYRLFMSIWSKLWTPLAGKVVNILDKASFPLYAGIGRNNY